MLKTSLVMKLMFMKKNVTNHPDDNNQTSLDYLREIATNPENFRQTESVPSTTTNQQNLPLLESISSSDNDTPHSSSLDLPNDGIRILDEIISNSKRTNKWPELKSSNKQKLQSISFLSQILL